jgi:hypothetical protein
MKPKEQMARTEQSSAHENCKRYFSSKPVHYFSTIINTEDASSKFWYIIVFELVLSCLYAVRIQFDLSLE